MAAGVATKLWEIADIAKLVEDAEAAAKKRGPIRAIVTAMSLAIAGAFTVPLCTGSFIKAIKHLQTIIP